MCGIYHCPRQDVEVDYYWLSVMTSLFALSFFYFVVNRNLIAQLKIMCKDCYKTLRSFSNTFLIPCYATAIEEHCIDWYTSNCVGSCGIIVYIFRDNFLLFFENLHALELIRSSSRQQLPEGPAITGSRMEISPARAQFHST